MANNSSALQIRVFETEDTEEVVKLWEECGLTRPWNDPRADIKRKLTTQPDLFLVVVDSGFNGSKIVGSVMAGYDGHRGWLYYLATALSHRRQGLGRALVAEAERRLEAVGCPKIQLMVRADNAQAADFYTGLDYEKSDVLVLGKRLIED